MPISDKIHNRSLIKKWLKTNNFCGMPFFHVAIESNGDVRPCCLGNPLKHDDGTVFNSNGMKIIDIINHPTHVKFRESFLKNEQHPACHVCWGDYHDDDFSGRLDYSATKLAEPILKIMDGSTTPKQELHWLEIKAGNRCNLSCRICGLWNSSKWLKEAYNWQVESFPDYPSFKDSKELSYNQTCKWIDDISFWTSIDGFDKIKLIHLMGGEPLMIPEHFEMLKLISEKYDPSEITVWYNTNGTIIPTPDQEKILSKFKRIKWSLSIDDFGKKFEYQRKGASWDEVKSNIFYFFSALPNFSSTIDSTINIHNVLTLDEFLNEIYSMNLASFFSPHFVNTPGSNGGTYNIRTLHPDIKKEVKTRLESLLIKYKSSNGVLYHHIKRIIEFMMFIDDWSELTDEIRKKQIYFVDKQRNESFKDVFPEMASLLNYE